MNHAPGRNTRVVRVITRLNVGGPARQALLLTKHLAASHPTTLAAGLPGANEGELLDPDVPVTRVSLVRPLAPKSDIRAFLSLRRLLTRKRPAIVHTHMAKAGTIGRLAALSMRDRPQMVHTFHGHVLEGYFGRSTARCFLAVERALARRTDVLVAVSEQTRDDLLGIGIGRAEQWRVIPLGLDLDRHLSSTRADGTLRAALDLAPEVPLIGVVGRLVAIKEVRLALEVLSRLPHAHMAILGDGDRRDELEGEATSMGLRGRTHFTGWWKDIPAAMTDLDVVLLTSRNEGTPVALIEAGACGRPVVATDVGGVGSVVVDGVTGHLHPSGDASGLAESIARLLGDRELGDRMGAAARIHVAERFTGERLIRDIASLYEELLGR
jgi:glycosyltransferase involved in cell wall biosynthesis